MKINQNGSTTAKVPLNTINTMMEQISNLQEDQETLQSQVNALGQSISTVSLDANDAQIDTLNTTNMTATEAEVNTLSASVSVNTAQLSAGSSDIGSAHADSLSTPAVVALSANISYGSVTKLNSTTAEITKLTADNIEAKNADIDAIKTDGITNSGDYTGKKVTVEDIESDSVTADTADIGTVNVTDTLNVKDINVNGAVTGLSELTADSVTSDEAHIESIENQKIFTSTLHPLTPTPLVDNNDRYTIELPPFAGTFVLTWKDGEDIKWTANVIGSGTNYQITFACTDEQLYITELFQWNNKLYIRHNANGQLLYSYNAEKELEPIHIYYNMVGWAEDKSLEELTDENTHYWVLRPAEVVLFGAVNIPRLQAEGQNVPYGIKYKGDCTVNTLPSLSDTDVGDVWNITSEGYTDARFVEGAGKPINAGDDVVAVEVTTSIPGEEIITESTFDYLINDVRIDEDDIYYATLQGLYKNGELVDSTPIRKIFIDVNKNIWATTSNQLSIGKYINGVFTETFTCTTQINDFVITSYGTAIIGTGYGGIGAGLFKSITSNTWKLLSNAATSPTDYLTYYDDSHIYASVYTGGYADGGLEFYNGTECVILNDQVGGSLNARPVVRSPEDIWYLCYIDQDGANGNLYHYDGETWTGYHVSDLVVDYDESRPLGNGYGLAVMNNKLYASFSNAAYNNTDLVVADLNEPNLEFHYVKHDIEYEDWTETVPVRISNLAYSSNMLIGWNWNNNGNPIDIYSIYATDPIPTAKVLKWNKFAAGVNYDNFAATNITASTALKSEGTLEVDGTSQFDNNVTVTGNITQTGNLNVTGNETISGLVIIGDLD